MSDGDWYMIENFLQDVYLVKNKLALTGFEQNLYHWLKQNCDAKETIDQIIKIAEKKNSMLPIKDDKIKIDSSFLNSLTDMDLEIFKRKVKENNIPDSLYSINEGLKINAYNLYKNYAIWEYFYLNEKGERKDFKKYKAVEDALDYIWEKLQTELKYPFDIPPKNPPKNFLW